MRLIGCCGVIAALGLAACADGGDTDDVPAVYFAMFHDGYDEGPFDAAWTAARADPAVGVDYGFPLVTAGLAEGTEIRLLAGRSTEDPSGPLTTGSDVILADERHVATAIVDAGGRAEPGPLAVATGAWTSDTNTIPADLLCGVTVIAARAYQRSAADPPDYRFLAATFFVAVAPPCE